MDIYLIIGDVFLGLILLVQLVRWWNSAGKWRRRIKRKFRR